MILFNLLGVMKPNCLTMSTLSATSGPPRFGPVINKTVTSYHNCSQLFLPKTKASALYDKGVRSLLDSAQQECKN